jgi:hypothetical protein
MREPRWLRGAYTTPPGLVRMDADKVVGRGAIECWRGTVAELCHAAEVLVDAVASDGTARLAVSVTWASGTQDRPRTLQGLRTALGKGDLSDLMVARLDVSSADKETSGTLLARRMLPGLIVMVSSKDQSRTLGATELVFQRMMVGYVDRMGGWRGPVWMALATAPLLLTVLAITPGEGYAAAWTLLTLLAAVSGITIFQLSYRALLVSTPLVVLEQLPETRRRRSLLLLLSLYHHRHTRRVLGGIAVLLVGVAGNKLAELIPFP